MSNKVKIERISEYCGKIFIAQTCNPRICSKACNSNHYKESIRNGRYNVVAKEVKEERKQHIKLSLEEVEFMQAKEFINLKKLGIYLGVYCKSVYTYLRKYSIPFSLIAGRIIVERNEIGKILIRLIQSIQTKPSRRIRLKNIRSFTVILTMMMPVDGLWTLCMNYWVVKFRICLRLVHSTRI